MNPTTTATASSNTSTASLTSPLGSTAPLLDVRALRVEFSLRHGVVVANDSVSYRVNPGETLAIIGESGSGKSVSAMAVMGLIDSPPGRIAAGQIDYRGTDLLGLSRQQRQQIRGRRISMIFQDALSALNPVVPVGAQLAEMFIVHEAMSRRTAKRRAVELIERVRIPDPVERANSYPHELSGGMRQRVMIAMAIALGPDVLIADEPTTALDVTVQAQVLDLLGELQADTAMGMILITHDLGVVAGVADRVSVMYAGRIIETGTIDEIYSNPSHPYTVGLMRSMPSSDSWSQRLDPIPGSPPDLADRPGGCAFHPRCFLARNECATIDPALSPLGSSGRASACLFPEQVTL